MLVYQDLVTGDKLLLDSFPYKEIQNGVLWEVEGKWVVKGALDVDIGANPSAEGGGEEEEGVDDQAVKVVDIVDTFRSRSNLLLIRSSSLPTSRSISNC